MAQAITINQSKGSRGAGVLVVRSDATGFISTTGNAPANSQANNVGEVISKMHIAESAWSCNAAADDWTIKRGGNTVFKCHGQNGQIDFAQNQMRLEASDGDAQANVVFTLAGAGNIIIKMHKSGGV